MLPVFLITLTITALSRFFTHEEKNLSYYLCDFGANLLCALLWNNSTLHFYSDEERDSSSIIFTFYPLGVSHCFLYTIEG